MQNSVLSIAVDILMGVSIAGLALAVLVPALIEAGVISTGDWTGGLIILAVLGTGAGLMLLRPGGTLRRRSK
jgi:hypothetical protein